MKNRFLTKISVAMLALIVSSAFLLEACAKELKSVDEPSGIITMTTTASEVSISVIGAIDITIDWGDGRTSNVNDATFYEDYGGFEFFQNYSGTSARNIVITGNVTTLGCDRNQLTALDVSRNTALTRLSCGYNQLTALDVSRNTALTILYCRENQITALDVSRNTMLEDLDCRINKLTTLDVSNNTALKRLDCKYNQITRLDVSHNDKIFLIACAGNQLTANALNDLFRSLPHYRGLQYGEYGSMLMTFRGEPERYADPGNPGVFDCDRSIAEKKGWIFYSDTR